MRGSRKHISVNKLVLSDIEAGYGNVRVLHGVNLEVKPGETVILLGVNGNGKTTLIRTIFGLIRPTRGRIQLHWDGVDVDLATLSTRDIVDLGLVLVPEGRRLLPGLSVEENLRLGAYRRAARPQAKRNMELCYEIFPVLKQRRWQTAGSMSGGEQQMVALGRALMTEPRILVIDEPSVGLSPLFVRKTIDAIKQLKEQRHLSVLMTEQNFRQAVRIADRGYVIRHGKIAFAADDMVTFQANESVRNAYLGN